MRLDQILTRKQITTNGGIFQAMLKKHPDLTFITQNEAIQWDNYYIFNSGRKLASYYTESFKDEHDFNTLINSMADLIYSLFNENWSRLHEALIETKYKALENYDLHEDENVGSKVSTSGKGQSSVYGYNSSVAAPAQESTSDSVVTGDFNDNHRQLTRHGNIGVTTSQQMLESEVELRTKYNFSFILFKDLDEILTCNYYILEEREDDYNDWWL